MARSPGSTTNDSLLHAGQRDDRDDFFCLRFRVWYPSFDCAVRTKFETCPGCRACEQGRFNLKRHAAGIARQRRAFRSF